MMAHAGWQSTEFWVSLAALVAGVVLVITGQGEIGQWIIAAATGGYSLSRGLAKAARK